MKVYNETRCPLERATDGSSGWDLRANLPHPLNVASGARIKIPTGIYCEIPMGYEGQIRGRSGLLLDYGIVVPLGTIDSDYRGEIHVVAFNLGTEIWIVEPGNRVGQLVIALVVHWDPQYVNTSEELSLTSRGSGGFGSTGR